MTAPAATSAEQLPEITGQRVLVTVGTDHHPFDRLIGWINDWLGAHPEQAAACFVQWGTAAVRPACPGSQFLGVGRLAGLLDAADIIVCHGGPASISDAWARGQLPIVVPRLPALGEHVDDHQADFCQQVAELGWVRLAHTPADFAGLLDEAARDRSRFRASLPRSDVAVATARLGELVEELVSRPPRRLPLIRRGWRTRQGPATGAGLPAGPGPALPELTPAASRNWQVACGEARTSLAGTAHEEQG